MKGDYMNQIVLMAQYNYKGSINSSLTLKQTETGDVDLYTSYGELITTVQSTYGLMRVIQDLEDDSYA